jgi:hypothetical protein
MNAVSFDKTQILNTLYDVGSTGITYIKDYGTIALQSLGELVIKVAAATGQILKEILSKGYEFSVNAKAALTIGILKLKDAFIALPSEVKLAGAIGAISATIITSAIFYCISPKKQQTETVTTA